MGVERQQSGFYQRSLFEGLEENPRPDQDGEARSQSVRSEEPQASAAFDPARALSVNLMEEVTKPDNLNRAFRQVRANKGAAGVDGMSVADLRAWIGSHKEKFIVSLLDGTYQPQSVRGVEIPKPGGGVRQLGIPTVVDRLVQQAILQVLEKILDPTFSTSSFGFRPRRGAHDALAQASHYVSAGRPIVVDLDLEKFFDRVNHDILMSRLARRIGDRRLLRIIRRFLACASNGTKGRRKGDRCLRCWRTCFWTTWIGNLTGVATSFAAMRTTATFTCGRWRRGNECWRR